MIRERRRVATIQHSGMEHEQTGNRWFTVQYSTATRNRNTDGPCGHGSPVLWDAIFCDGV